MKKALYVPLLMASVLMSNCHCSKTGDPNSPDSASLLTGDSLQTPADSTLWGRMGEGTSMNVMEFITDNGDTLYLQRYSEQTEQEGEVVGFVRNFTDRFAVTTRGKNIDEGNSIQTCVNVSQMMGTWKGKDGNLSLYVDGSADNGFAHYTSWQMVNGMIVLSGKISTEYGETDRIDTMQIQYLDDDSLKLLTPQHEVLSFGK